MGQRGVRTESSRKITLTLIDKAKGALGTSSEELIAKKNQEERELRQRLAEEEKQLKEKEKQTSLEQKTAENVQNLRSRMEQTKARREAMEEEHGSTLEQQNEIDRLKQLEKILKPILKTRK